MLLQPVALVGRHPKLDVEDDPEQAIAAQNEGEQFAVLFPAAPYDGSVREEYATYDDIEFCLDRRHLPQIVYSGSAAAA